MIKKLAKNILLFLNTILVIVTLLSYLSIYISPNTIWYFSFFGLAFPFLILFNLIFIVIWAVKGKKYIFLSIVTLIIGWNYNLNYFQFTGQKSDEFNITVLSYNVQHFSSENSSNEEENVKDIIQFLKNQNADIICLQEVRLRKNELFNLKETVKDLPDISHYQYARSSSTYGLTTMTRFPIVGMNEIRFENSTNITIYTDVLIESDTVRVFNVHLQSYRLNPDDYPIINENNISNKKGFNQLEKFSRKLQLGFKKRAYQADIVKEYIDNSPYPVIVCGDFNDTPISYSYHTLKGDLTDAFVSSGKGLGRTYVGKYPSYRIDYILHSDEFNSYNFKTLDFKKSDHLPIITNLQMIE